MHVKKFLYFIIVILWCCSVTDLAYAKPLAWQTIMPGLDYIELTLPNANSSGRIHAFRFDLAQYRLSLLFANEFNRERAPIYYFVNHSKALIGVNGGFFSPQFKPLGLRIKNGVMINKLKRTSWWGVFYIRKNRAYILSPRQFRYNKQITFAVQGGPRLLVNGRIPPLKGGVAERTALGITKKGKVVLLVTENSPLTTTQLAKIMRQSINAGGFGCVNALNLDGGSSSQLYARIGNFRVNVPNFKAITDAVVVLPKD